MLAYLKGVLMGFQKGRWILDVHNVGYEVFVPSHYDVHLGEETELWIYTHVREDAFSLYGFKDEKEKEVFTALIGISGIGPKMALGVLSSVRYQELIKRIESEDIAGLKQLPKIGAKTAQQMALSLKGKWPHTVVLEKDSQHSEVQNEIFSALIKLGFRSVEIKQVLDKVNLKNGVKDGIRHALSLLRNL